MANKRDIKKYIRNTCGSLASEIILARAAFPQIDRKTVYEIIRNIAALQASSLAKVSVTFDKKRSSFVDAETYNKESRAFYKKAYDTLLDEFDKKIYEILKEMNAALPQEVRNTIKEVAAE